MNGVESVFASAHNILMIVHDFHLLRVGTAPDEANPPLVVDANAVLAVTAALEGFQPVAGRVKSRNVRARCRYSSLRRAVF
jgi:hypothetical protein